MTFTFDPLSSALLTRSFSYFCPALYSHYIRSSYGFPVSRKSEARDGWTDGQTDGVQRLMQPVERAA